MKLRNENGVTLITLFITIIVLMIITGITFLESNSQLQIKDVNCLYSDIETLNTAISQYYLENGDLPILGEYTSNKAEMALEVGGIEKLNPDDSGTYFTLDLSKLENLTLNYGIEYKKWTSASDKYEDIYVINETTHQIYYIEGVELKGETYHTSPTYK